MNRDPLRGSLVALPTPFREGQLDVETLARLVELHAGARTAGVVVAGSTGEAHALSGRERRDVIDCAVQAAGGRIPVIAGTGTSETRGTCELTRFAAEVGANGVLVVAPPYARPGRRGLVRHFQEAARAAGDVAVCLYNNPVRCGVDVEPDTVAEIARGAPNVRAIKDASGSIERVRALVALDGIDVLAGEDSLIAEAVLAGAAGAVSVAGNLAPDLVADLIDACVRGDDDARALLEARLAPLLALGALDTNPTPVKAALAELGFGTPEVRGPLTALTEPDRARLRALLVEADLTVRQ